VTWNSEHHEISMLLHRSTNILVLRVRSTNILVLLLGGGDACYTFPSLGGGGGVFARQSTAGVGGRGGASASTNSVEILVARYKAQKKYRLLFN
jgi:hypothetical protein